MPKLKLNDDMIDKIVKYMEQGNYIETVCRILHISEPTYYSYIKKAEQAKKDNIVNIYVKLLNAIKEAESVAEAKAVACILQDKSWQSKAWYLERKHRQRWALQQDITINATQNNQYAMLSDSELKALIQSKAVVHDVECIDDRPAIENNCSICDDDNIESADIIE